MVQLKHEHDVDSLLSCLETHWTEVPEVADLWEAEMDREDEEIYHLEWSIKEDNLALLETQVVGGNLTAQQYRRYKALGRMIDQKRPVLERLFASR